MINLGSVFILGDSYSTFQDHIPNGYHSWYFSKEQECTDVNFVEETWWMQLLSSTNSKLVQNNSFSGTTVCNTCRPALSVDTSFIERFDKLANDGFFDVNPVDTFFIFGGTNDSYIDVPLGELMYEDFNKEDLLAFFPAFCYLISRIKAVLPKTKIVALINTEIKEEIIEGIKKACKHFSVDCIQLRNIGKQAGHPNKAGMTHIKDQIIEYLSK